MNSMQVLEDDYIVHDDGHIEDLLTGSTLNTYVREIYGCKYLYVTIHGKSKRVARIVAEAFVPNPEGKRFVTYINGNNLDCRAANLYWATGTELRNYEYAHGRKCHRYQKEMTDAAIAVTSKPVRCVETSQEFPSEQEAGRYFKESKYYIRKASLEGAALPKSGYHLERMKK